MARINNPAINKSTSAVNKQAQKVKTSPISEIYSNLSPMNICRITPCDKDGNLLQKETVQGLFVDGNETIESQWQTPFENSNPEHKLPTLMATLQSGQLLDTMGSVLGTPVDGSIHGEIVGKMEQLVGKTSLTKVNTQQIFLSTQSVRMSLTLFFIALRDAEREVERQIAQLKKWSLPLYLYDGSIVQNMAENGVTVANAFPSDIPEFVAITIHGKTYKPFIIENVSNPLKAPIDSKGNRLSVSVELSVMSRQAWDSRDVDKLYGFSL